MSLFGKKCARCGRRHKEVSVLQPSCRDCLDVIEAKLRADHEALRSCPLDGSRMVKEVAHVIVIDRCPACQGVWLDAGELDQIKDEVAAKTVSAMLPTAPYAAA